MRSEDFQIDPDIYPEPQRFFYSVVITNIDIIDMSFILIGLTLLTFTLLLLPALTFFTFISLLIPTLTLFHVVSLQSPTLTLFTFISLFLPALILLLILLQLIFTGHHLDSIFSPCHRKLTTSTVMGLPSQKVTQFNRVFRVNLCIYRMYN